LAKAQFLTYPFPFLAFYEPFTTFLLKPLSTNLLPPVERGHFSREHPLLAHPLPHFPVVLFGRKATLGCTEFIFLDGVN
jgi:hypothetical protein